MTVKFKDDLERRLQNPAIKKEYDALKNEFIIIQAIIDARKKLNLTQKDLSERSGINQADISRIERGLANPTLKLLHKLATGLNMEMEIRFIPKTK